MFQKQKQTIRNLLRKPLDFLIKLIKLLGTLCLIVGIFWTAIFSVMAYEKTSQFIADPVNIHLLSEVFVPSANAELPVKEYVKQELEKAGLGNEWELVDCIIYNESRWNNWAYNINSNGSTDFGLLQWNSETAKSRGISVECRWDYKCSVKEAINKRLADKNWCAWYGAAKCGLKCN